MASPSLDFKCALVTGGGGGIGKALAAYLVANGKKVLIAGRTESKLVSAAEEIKAAGYYVLDTGDIPSLAAFVDKITREHPDLDCLINNAGVQRPLSVTQDPAADFLRKADQEIDINVRGPLHLSLGLLPHLRTKPSAAIVNVSSVLGFVPFSIINPVYNGTKAFMHFWSMALRTQLRHGGTGVRVVEIAPPMVGTDLHRDREDPDDNKKNKNPEAMSLEEFIDGVAPRLVSGEEMITAGMGKELVDKWYASYGEVYAAAERKLK